MDSLLRVCILTATALPVLHASALAARSVTECQDLYRTGQYEQCLVETTTAIADRSYGEEWPILKARCELATGRYPNALETIEAGIARYSWSIRLRMLQHDAAFANGKPDLAAEALLAIEKLVSSASWRYTDADDLVALGAAALALGADAKDVQEGFFERARRNFRNRPDGFVAAGQLANQKADFQLAGEILLPAVKDFEDNPDILFEASEALRTADKQASMELLQKVLNINPHYAPALCRIVEQQIDGEDYSQAETTLDRLLQMNPHSPEAHSLQAVIHHLANDVDSENASIAAATQFSGPSAAVFHLMGRKLSQKYRFAEGAQYQRKALQATPDFAPARIQLAQDLLRLGQEPEGWMLAEEAYSQDGYNTTLFNLLQLRDSMQQFTTIETPHFLIRMDADEAIVYGRQVEQLLETAWAEMTARYQFTPQGQVVVEIFDRADDFAVRTFGIPDVAGFLGVCFGNVITANSPATRRQSPTNWESVLWHEFCHVITLQMTGNKIPRWLSEGISVYEERLRDPRWGQRMNAEYKQRILGDEDRVTPVAQLSNAFLTAKDGLDLNFVYYESSMVVEHIVREFGNEALLRILQDLNQGLMINDALSRHTNGLEQLELQFSAFLKNEAARYAPEAVFDTELDDDLQARLEQLGAEHPLVINLLEQRSRNVPATMALANQYMAQQDFQNAEATLQRAIQLIPEDSSVNGPRRLLADLYQRQNKTTEEAAVLADHLQRTADDLEALLRLQELSDQSGDAVKVVDLGRSIMAVDPFQTVAMVRMARSAEATQDIPSAILALTSLLQLQPDDAAAVHLRLARQMLSSDPQQARRNVLLSLQEAPRYRDAHKVLLELVRTHESSPAVEDGTENQKPADPASATAPAEPSAGDPGAPNNPGDSDVVKDPASSTDPAGSTKQLPEDSVLPQTGSTDPQP